MLFRICMQRCFVGMKKHTVVWLLASYLADVGLELTIVSITV
jgi:hypothetical protein